MNMLPRVVSALTSVACGACLAAASPPVFTAKPYAEAKAQAAAEHKLLIVDSMADWCGPCKQMDKTTWVDESVIKWVKENAIAVQFDVDKDEALATQFKIDAMPTVIVLKDGKEFDRVVGYQKSGELIEWLEGVKRGETSLDKARKAAGERRSKDGKVDVKARLDLARKLASGGKEDEAAQEYAWLWENMLKYDEAMVGVRVSFMAGDMKRLAEGHEPSLKRFTKMRDALEANLKAKKSNPDELSDWIVLNEVVNDDDRTLAWFDRVKNDPEAAPDLKRNDYRLSRLLEEKGRWADFVKLSRDPVAAAKEKVSFYRMSIAHLPEEHAEEMRRFSQKSLRVDIAHLYAGLLACGRENEADRAAAVLTDALDDAPSRRALVTLALDAGQPRERQIKLLDEADVHGLSQADPDLRPRLKAALEKAKSDKANK